MKMAEGVIYNHCVGTMAAKGYGVREPLSIFVKQLIKADGMTKRKKKQKKNPKKERKRNK